MGRDYSFFRRINSNRSYVIICRREDLIIGWALVTEGREGGLCVYVYIRREFRRKGIGSRIIKYVLNSWKDRDINTYVHDHLSDGFYSKLREIHGNRIRIHDNY